MGVYVDTMYMAMLPECFCFVFSLVQHVAAFHWQWPLAQLFPAACEGSISQCSGYISWMSMIWYHYVCSGHWHNYSLQAGQALRANAQSIFL
jgi:hypothetical protein